MRWYLGYGLDESLLDAAKLTRLRQRLGQPVFRRFFEHVVDLCVEAGLVWGQELIADARYGTGLNVHADRGDGHSGVHATP